LRVEEDIPEIVFDLKQGSAIDFIVYDQAKQRFDLDPKAVEAILNASANTGLILNIGEPKIGKSFLLNKAMDLDRGYLEGSKGIKMWSKPFYREEEDLYLFFVDVQGLGTDEKFSDFIWMLSFLVGTIVIYNSKGDINDKTFECMKPLANMTRSLKISQDEVENGYMMSYYAPKLIWVIKDFRDVEDANGKPMSPDKYLETSLLELSANNRTNNIKKFLTAVMKEHTCVTFPPFSKIDQVFNRIYLC